MEQEPLCQICFIEYDDKRERMLLLPCNHYLCHDCLTKAVVSKKLCPFCKQLVKNVLTPREFKNLDDFQPSEVPETPLDQFELLDHSFFQEDISVLVQRLKACFQRLRQIISQKDYDFDTKWKMYESVESQVYELQETINNRVPINPQSVINQIQQLSQEVEELKNGRWGSPNLLKYKEAPQTNFPTFFLATEKKQKKKKGRK